ncbi:hypothetical protein EJB05_26343, partial [Eragrostis curvula]
MEDVVNTFLVHVQGPDPPSRRRSKRFIQKMKRMLAMGKSHQIGEQMEEIKNRVMEVAEHRDRYKVDIDSINHVSTLDPRITSLYTKATQLVGIDEAREELIMKLTKEDGMPTQQQRIVSVVGFGGLGKTTLAKAVYDKLKVQFECTAFVTISMNPDLKKFLKNMLYELDNKKYGDIHNKSLDVNHLIDLAREFLNNKRYFIIIDDIWDIPNWDIIKYSLPDDSSGSRIITTTRNITVAEHIGDVYKMKALSEDNSKLLMYTRIFGNADHEKCHDEDLSEVSNRILKKCAGVPLAIITIASLLARKGRNKMDWYNVYNSIGAGMENSLDVENMRKILSYSYYDMPPQLRTCLLYLSMLPEDCEILKDRLIRLWIAEGFIHCEEKGKSLFEIGESYFSELINRSMIQPVYDDFLGIDIKSCRLHDMVLDLVRSLSSEENFVTVLTDAEHTSALTKARRLSLQNSDADHASIWGTRSMPQVRSLVVFSSAINQIPALQSFKVLRVLDLKDCYLSQGYSLKYLGSLLHLRYLNLYNTWIDQLPKEVENLQFLETLDIQCNNISHLQLNIGQFKHLLCLLVDYETIVSNGIWSLKSLEELSWLHMDDELMDHIEELGLITELRVLCMSLHTDKWNNKIVETLSKLQKIQTLRIDNDIDGQLNVGGLNAWVAHGHLRHLNTKNGCWFSRLPAWLNNPSHLADLCELYIAVRELQEKDLNVLGRLPALTNLYLLVDHESLGIRGRFVVGAGSFSCLAHCVLEGFVEPVVFEQGAMPRLTMFEFHFHVREVREIAGSDGGLDLGLQNLPSLQTVYVYYRSGGASKEEVEEAKAAVRKAAEIHPNKLELVFFMLKK